MIRLESLRIQKKSQSFIFPFASQYVSFLRNKESIVVVGTVANKNTNVQLISFSNSNSNSNSNINVNRSDSLNNNEDDSERRVLTKVTMPGQCNAVEICGVLNTSQNYIAVATSRNGRGLLQAATLNVLPDEDDINSTPCVQTIATHEQCAYTSISYDSYHSYIAECTEDGQIIINDLNSGTEVTRNVECDPCGLTSLKYTSSNTLISLGYSSKHPLQVWDVRTSLHKKSALSYEGCGNAFELTEFIVQPLNEQLIVCSTGNGRIFQWDIRQNKPGEERQVHENRVTALTPLPNSPGYVLSGARDGTVEVSHFKLSPTDISNRAISTEMSGVESISASYDGKDLAVVNSCGGLSLA